MFTVVSAWLAVLAVLAGAVLFGQTARTAPRPRRPRPRSARLGRFISLSGPWLSVLIAGGTATISGAWLVAAAAGACGVAFAAVLGLMLDPR